MNDSVIQLENLRKVFLTDEVETHALTRIELAIKLLAQCTGINQWSGNSESFSVR